MKRRRKVNTGKRSRLILPPLNRGEVKCEKCGAGSGERHLIGRHPELRKRMAK